MQNIHIYKKFDYYRQVLELLNVEEDRSDVEALKAENREIRH